MTINRQGPQPQPAGRASASSFGKVNQFLLPVWSLHPVVGQLARCLFLRRSLTLSLPGAARKGAWPCRHADPPPSCWAQSWPEKQTSMWMGERLVGVSTAALMDNQALAFKGVTETSELVSPETRGPMKGNGGYRGWMLSLGSGRTHAGLCARPGLEGDRGPILRG